MKEIYSTPVLVPRLCWAARTILIVRESQPLSLEVNPSLNGPMYLIVLALAYWTGIGMLWCGRGGGVQGRCGGAHLYSSIDVNNKNENIPVSTAVLQRNSYL